MINNIGYIGAPLTGIEVYINDSIGWHEKQIRFPCSKKRRIRLKWFKNKKNWRRWQEAESYQVKDVFLGRGSFIVMNSTAAKQISRGANE